MWAILFHFVHLFVHDSVLDVFFSSDILFLSYHKFTVKPLFKYS